MASQDTVTCYDPAGRPVAVPRDRIQLRATVYAIAFTPDRGQVLLIRGARPADWALPGGPVRAAEAAAEALHRGVEAQAGLTFSAGPPIYWADSFVASAAAGPPSGFHVVELFYLVQPTGPLAPHLEESRGTGHAGAAWVPLEELETLDLPGAHYDAVQQAAAWLEATEGPAMGDDDDDDD